MDKSVNFRFCKPGSSLALKNALADVLEAKDLMSDLRNLGCTLGNIDRLLALCKGLEGFDCKMTPMETEKNEGLIQTIRLAGEGLRHQIITYLPRVVPSDDDSGLDDRIWCNRAIFQVVSVIHDPPELASFPDEKPELMFGYSEYTITSSEGVDGFCKTIFRSDSYDKPLIHYSFRYEGQEAKFKEGEIICLDQMVYGLPSFSHGTTRLMPTKCEGFLFYSDEEGTSLFEGIDEGFYLA